MLLVGFLIALLKDSSFPSKKLREINQTPNVTRIFVLHLWQNPKLVIFHMPQFQFSNEEFPSKLEELLLTLVIGEGYKQTEGQ